MKMSTINGYVDTYIYIQTIYFLSTIINNIECDNNIIPTCIHTSQNIKKNKVISNIKDIYPTLNKKRSRNQNTKNYNTEKHKKSL